MDRRCAVQQPECLPVRVVSVHSLAYPGMIVPDQLIPRFLFVGLVLIPVPARQQQIQVVCVLDGAEHIADDVVQHSGRMGRSVPFAGQQGQPPPATVRLDNPLVDH